MGFWDKFLGIDWNNAEYRQALDDIQAHKEELRQATAAAKADYIDISTWPEVILSPDGEEFRPAEWLLETVERTGLTAQQIMNITWDYPAADDMRIWQEAKKRGYR